MISNTALTQADMDDMRDRIDVHFESNQSAHNHVLANVQRFLEVPGLGWPLAHSYMAQKLTQPPGDVFAMPAFKVCPCDNGFVWERDGTVSRCARCLGVHTEPTEHDAPAREPLVQQRAEPQQNADPWNNEPFDGDGWGEEPF